LGRNHEDNQGLANPFSTGGGGCTFEDAVAASYLTALLCGQTPLGQEGVTAQVRLQARWAGSLLDDVSITTDVGGKRRRLDVQVKNTIRLAKSDRHFLEVLTAAWQTFSERPGGFDPRGDKLAVAFGSQVPHFDALRALLRLADGALTSDEFMQKVHLPRFASNEQRHLGELFRTVLSDVAKKQIGDGELWRFLRCFVPLHFDFSDGEGVHALLCREGLLRVLASGNAIEAGQLFCFLRTLAREQAARSGTLDRDSLWARVIRADVRLRDREDYSRDLRLLREHRGVLLRRIRDHLPERVHVPRSGILEAVRASAHSQAFTAITGLPGTGKSALVKALACELARKGEVIALDAGEAGAGVLAPGGLDHSWDDILGAVGTSDRWLVIDGFESIMGSLGKQRVVGDILNSVQARNDSLPSDSLRLRWAVIIVCRDEEWEHLMPMVPALLAAKQGDKLGIVGVSEFTDEELEQLGNDVPRLKQVLARPKLRTLLRRPFYLDALLSREASLDPGDLPDLLTEVWLMDWFWQDIVRLANGARQGPGEPALREQVLVELARQSILTASPWSPERDFDAQALRGLRDERLVQVHDGRARIAHDTIVDWALTRLMINDSGHVPDLLLSLNEAYSLNRPFTLFALRGLEHERSVEKWEALLHQAEDDPRLSPRWARLVLVAPLTSSCADDLLGMLERAYLEGGGALLRKTLHALRTERTIPDPRFADMGVQGMADYVRFPIWQSWLPVLRLVLRNAGAVPSAAVGELAEVVKLWMARTPSDWPLRRELTELAIKIYEQYAYPWEERRGTSQS